jgi:hypothetical protein
VKDSGAIPLRGKVSGAPRFSDAPVAEFYTRPATDDKGTVQENPRPSFAYQGCRTASRKVLPSREGPGLLLRTSDVGSRTLEIGAERRTVKKKASLN